MAFPTLMKRIAVLEQNRERASDPEILAWGRTVTDDELLAIAGNKHPGVMGLRAIGVLSDANLLRYLRPVIQAQREGR